MNENIKTWDELNKNLIIDNIEEQANKIISQIIIRRTELGLSQRDLAELSGIKQPAIARMESFRAIPQLDTLLRITSALSLKLILIENKE